MKRVLATIALALAAAVPGPALALTPGQAAVLLGPNPCANAPLTLSFSGLGLYCLNGVRFGAFVAVPGATFTRASSGYGQTAAGSLVLFGSNIPRITDQGVLIEGASTNLLTQSQDFTQAAWNKFNIAAVASGIAAPDGTTTGSVLTAAAGNTIHEVTHASTLGAATNGALTMYVKPGTSSFAFLNIANSAANYATAIFDVTACSGAATQTSVGGTSGTITSTSATALANGWCRISMVAQVAGANAPVENGIAGSATGNALTTSGEPTFNAAGTETQTWWGAQLETGAFATSYIATGAATATRAADSMSISGLALPSAALTLLASGAPSATITTYIAELSDGTTNNSLSLDRIPSKLEAFEQVSGVAIYDVSGGTWTAGVRQTAGISATAGAQFSSLGGASLASGISASQVTGMSKLTVGGRTPFDGYIQKVQVFTSAYTQGQLNAATAQ